MLPVPLLLRDWLLSVFVKKDAAFCKPQEEKKPPAGVVSREPDFELGVLASSTVGVKGAVIAFESLLGCPTADAERVRRCDIILPERLTTMPEASSDAAVDFLGDVLGAVYFGSVGVGGVTVVSGALTADPGGVAGRFVVSMDGSDAFADLTLVDKSVLIAEGTGGTGGGSSAAFAFLFALRLLFLVPLVSVLFVPFPSRLAPFRSGSVFALLGCDEKASLNFCRGEVPRAELMLPRRELGPSGAPSVSARSGRRRLVDDSEGAGRGAVLGRSSSKSV